MTTTTANGTLTNIKLGAVAIVCAIAVFLGYLAYLQLSGNIHAVVDGEAYRAAQLSPEMIEETSEQYGIRTILNLRGENAGTDWYDKEVKEANRLGIRHIDFRMSAGRELTTDEAKSLIAIMESAQKPLLIHCKAGADRTGLASAFYVAAVAKLGEKAAEDQISIRYGHFSLSFISAYAMNRTFEAMEPVLGFTDS
jgi:protein tyrosine/serine phosphatase